MIQIQRRRASCPRSLVCSPPSPPSLVRTLRSMDPPMAPSTSPINESSSSPRTHPPFPILYHRPIPTNPLGSKPSRCPCGIPSTVDSSNLGYLPTIISPPSSQSPTVNSIDSFRLTTLTFRLTIPSIHSASKSSFTKVTVSSSMRLWKKLRTSCFRANPNDQPISKIYRLTPHPSPVRSHSTMASIHPRVTTLVTWSHHQQTTVRI